MSLDEASFRMSILQNAVDSIAVGIEDYDSDDPRRLLSCSRNIFSGILLLLKHKLVEMSPPNSDEVLIKQLVFPQVDTTSGIVWRGKGKKTVDFDQIRERLTTLGIAVEWRRLEKVRDYRNNIEHYYSLLDSASARGLIADSFIVIRDFVRLQLKKEPLELFGPDTWNTMADEASVYEKEKEECVTHLDAIDWGYEYLREALAEHHCQKCGSGLIDVASSSGERAQAQFNCRLCGLKLVFEEIVPLAISEFASSETFSAAKDGGESATILCPNCNEWTYVLSENACMICETSVARECQRCGCSIPAEEIDGEGYCGWCAHMMAKDD